MKICSIHDKVNYIDGINKLRQLIGEKRISWLKLSGYQDCINMCAKYMHFFCDYTN